jgi:hypothetical protein
MCIKAILIKVALWYSVVYLSLVILGGIIFRDVLSGLGWGILVAVPGILLFGPVILIISVFFSLFSEDFFLSLFEGLRADGWDILGRHLCNFSIFFMITLSGFLFWILVVLGIVGSKKRWRERRRQRKRAQGKEELESKKEDID